VAPNRLAGMLGRLSPLRTRAADGELQSELVRLRRRLRRSRARVRELEAALRETRRSVGDPWPDLALPEHVASCVDAVHEEHLSYLGRASLTVLAKAVVELEAAQRPGLVVEAGTARGGAAIVMASAKASGRPMKVYDVFGMIPPPSDKDGDDVHDRYARIVGGESTGLGGDVYYGYRDDLYEEVRASFERYGVPPDRCDIDLVRGLFQDTMDLDEPVALAHLDGDWYESTMVCLERIAPLLVPGGRIVVDDYYAWSGCRAAVDEYFSDRPGFRLEHRARVHVVRL
jgi:O-methyltransferase